MPAARPDPHALAAPLAGHRHVALAVSGGSDSAALLHLAAILPAPRISVLTVDHGLRPESAGEARQVAAWSASLRLPHHTLLWSCPQPGSGIQARARTARYDLMSAWCRDNDATALVTAHTLDDQAETVLMRLRRTDSIASIAGIPAVGDWKGIGLLRPLLGHRRAALRAWLAELGQNWIEDPSNADPRFERVRLRGLMPDLAAAGLTPERLATLAAACAAQTAEVDVLAGQWCARHVVQRDGFGTVPAPAFRQLPQCLRERILSAAIAHYGGGGPPERGEIQRLDRAMAEECPRRSLGGALVWRSGDRLQIGREPGRIDRAPVPVPPAGVLLWDRRYQVTAPYGYAVLPAGATPLPRRSRDLPATVLQTAPAFRRPDGEIVLPGQDPATAAAFLPFSLALAR